MAKKFIYFFLFVGSFVGGYVPALWGGDIFSVSSLIWSGIGGLVGIYLGFILGRQLE